MKGKKVVVTLMAVMLLVLPTVMIASAAEPGDPDTVILITDATLECGSTATSRILVSIVNQETDPKEVRGVEIHLTFDPNLLQVVDADGDPGNGAQLTVESDLFDGNLHIVNWADNEAGTIVFAVAQSEGTPVFNATEKAIATITWERAGEGPPEQVGTEVRVAGNTLMSDPAGYPVVVDCAVNGTITIPPCASGCIEGYIFPQGHYDLGGVRVVAGPYEAYTNPTGYFKLQGVEASVYEVQAEMYGYLGSVALGVEVAVGECPDIGATKLRGGDVVPQPVSDNVVDTLDVSHIGASFWTAEATADVNGDGVVSILDLAVTAANFGRTGPTSWLPPSDPTPWTKDPYTALRVTGPSFGCGQTSTSQILVSIANNPAQPRLVHGVQVHLSFDPTLLQVVDADGNPYNGVQIAANGGLFPLGEQFVVQEVDNEAGDIYFVVTRLGGGSVQDATDAPIATITWAAAFDCATMTEEVCSAVSIVDALMSDPDGYGITVDNPVPGTVCIEPIVETGCIVGSVQIQGRDDHSGATVTAGGALVHPDPDGNFRLENLPPDIYTVQAKMDGYLDVTVPGVQVVAGGECTDIGAAELKGGDANGDGVIDILDVSYIASRFRSTDPTADINGDGVVDIRDLTMVVVNSR
jgi:hypothetical protein